MTYAQEEDDDDDDDEDDDDEEEDDDRRAETVGNDVQYIHWHTQVMPSN